MSHVGLETEPALLTQEGFKSLGGYTTIAVGMVVSLTKDVLSPSWAGALAIIAGGAFGWWITKNDPSSPERKQGALVPAFWRRCSFMVCTLAILFAIVSLGAWVYFAYKGIPFDFLKFWTTLRVDGFWVMMGWVFATLVSSILTGNLISRQQSPVEVDVATVDVH